jgi:GT2 family glycosyltransferase
MAPELSVIIVNYKTPEYLLNSIRSVFANSTGLSVEVIVVDNDSQDESEKLVTSNFTDVCWINMGYNAGFSRANNAGIRKAAGDYILLLNSDTIIIGDCLQKSLNYYKKLEQDNFHPGLLGCKMNDLNGNILFSSNDSFPGIKKTWDANPIKIFFTRKNQKTHEISAEEKKRIHSSNHQSAWLGVAFALCNRKLFDRDQLFMDEDFFMYGEDMEWCYRIAKKGYHHFFYSEAEIFHVNSGSSGINEWKSAQVIISEWLYILKTRGHFYYLAFLLLIKFNFLLDYFLYLKSSRHNRSRLENQIFFEQLNKTNILLHSYGWKIIKQFKTKPSSAINFLKYGPE